MSDIKYRMPVDYIAITTFFGGNHKGVDFGWSRNHGGNNVPIYASADGIIYAIKDNDTTKKSWGNYIKIKHSDGNYTMYAHLKTGSLKVKVGDNVKMGEEIARMGNTGKATGNHLHFEFYKGGVGTSYRVNPLLYTFVYPEQIVCDVDKDKVRYYNPNDKEKIIKELEEAKVLINSAIERIEKINAS